MFALASGLSDHDLLDRIACARRQGARGVGRAGRPPGRARCAAVPLRRARSMVRSSAIARRRSASLRRRRVQSHRRGSGLPAFPGDPRRAGLGRVVADLRPAARVRISRRRTTRPFWREASGRSRREIEELIARAGAASGRAVFGPEASMPASARHSAAATAGDDSGRGGRTGALAIAQSPAVCAAPSDRRAHLAGALSRPVHGRQGEPRQAAAPAGASAPRDPGRRSRRDLRSCDHAAPREGREGEDRRGGEAAAAAYPSRDG